jgi:hypothetical protein
MLKIYVAGPLTVEGNSGRGCGPPKTGVPEEVEEEEEKEEEEEEEEEN